MGLIDNFINKLRFGNENDEYDENDEHEELDDKQENYQRYPNFAQEKSRISFKQRSGGQNRNGMKLVAIKPNCFDDVINICNPLLEGKVVVINMEGIHGDISRRIIDFVSGSTYSIRGNLQKISNYIVVATPESVELSGEFADVLNNAYETQGFTFKV